MKIDRRKMIFSILAGLAATIVGPTIATAAKWELLGRRRVKMSADRDEIPVTFLRGSFKRLQLRVYDNAVNFQRVRVAFENGENFDANIRDRIKPGGMTRQIDLPGRRRNISKIVLRYDSVNNSKGRARVEVWGIR